jgi:hypothetical protein
MKKVLVLVTALGIMLGATNAANAQFWGGYGWGYGGWGYGAAGLGAGLAIGALAGAAIAGSYYPYAYGYYAPYPTYYYPVNPVPTRRVIVKKRVRDPVYVEEDYYGY